MEEKKYECRFCDNLPTVLQGIIVYELAIIIVILIFFLFDTPDSITEPAVETIPTEVK
ncbi:MAG: hypothetical protein ACOX7U_01145 [Desulfitobacteriia bacterium]|jgi:hypothetical protein